MFCLMSDGRQYDTKNIGFCRNDGLSISKSANDKFKASATKTIVYNGLDVIIDCYMKIVNYLDITFHLNNRTYRPYQKPDSII